TTAQATLPGGGYFGFYLIPGGTAAGYLAGAPGPGPGHRPAAYFSFPAANADRFRHFHLPAVDTIAAEDRWKGGERDFNHAVVRWQLEAPGGVLGEQIPVVTILAPPDGSLTNRAVTVDGRVTDGTSGVATLKARIDPAAGGTGVPPLIDVTFDPATGSFQF